MHFESRATPTTTCHSPRGRDLVAERTAARPEAPRERFVDDRRALRARIVLDAEIAPFGQRDLEASEISGSDEVVVEDHVLVRPRVVASDSYAGRRRRRTGERRLATPRSRR